MFTWSNATDNVEVDSYEIKLNRDIVHTEPHNDGLEEYSFFIENLEEKKEYVFTLTAKDKAGNVSKEKTLKVLFEKDHIAPVITKLEMKYHFYSGIGSKKNNHIFRINYNLEEKNSSTIKVQLKQKTGGDILKSSTYSISKNNGALNYQVNKNLINPKIEYVLVVTAIDKAYNKSEKKTVEFVLPENNLELKVNDEAFNLPVIIRPTLLVNNSKIKIHHYIKSNSTASNLATYKMEIDPAIFNTGEHNLDKNSTGIFIKLIQHIDIGVKKEFAKIVKGTLNITSISKERLVGTLKAELENNDAKKINVDLKFSMDVIKE